MTKEFYRFSPILSQEKFLEALDYVAASVPKLGEVVLGELLPVDTIAIFTHSDEEFTYLEPLVREYGPESRVSHGKTFYVDSDFEVQGQKIKYLGLRRPDTERTEVGYGDFPVADLEALRVAQANNQCVWEIQSGRGQDMLELRHPDFDVRAYVVSALDH